MKMHDAIKKLLLLVFMTLAASSAMALNEDAQGEIGYLLSYIENSGCEFERNGDTYDAYKARQHIQKKYEYIMRWRSDRIKGAEDFIVLAASESSLSGEKYRVSCSGLTHASADWLLDELFRYRNKK